MSANPRSTRIPRLHPPGTLGEEVNSWDSRSEFDPTVTLCSDHLSALLGWPHSLTFSLSLSVSPSLRLPPTDYPPNYVSKRNEKMYCVLLNASCVCLCSSSCHPLPLCRHCGLSMLQWSEEKGMCFKHHLPPFSSCHKSSVACSAHRGSISTDTLVHKLFYSLNHVESGS